MNYELWMDITEPFKLHDFTTDAAFRPRVGDMLQIPKQPLTIYKVNRCEPTNNPDNVMVKYFVEETTDTIPGVENSLVQVYEPDLFFPKGLTDIT